MSEYKDMREPKRWKEGGAASLDGVAEAMHALAAERASAAQVARLQARLGPQLAAPTHGGTLSSAPAALAGLGVGRGWPWLSAVLAGAAITWSLTQHTATRPAPRAAVQAPSVPQVEPTASSSPHHVPPSAAVAIPELAPTRVAAPAARVARKDAAASTLAPNEAQGEPAPEAELLLLRQAQSALNRAASAALPLLSEHERLYPEGLFVQEREMLLIEAELTLGHRAQALTRAKRFSQRFASSTYRTRIDTLLSTRASLKDQEALPPESTQ